MNTTCIKIEGGLLAPDFLETIADAEGQKAADFGIEGRRTLVDEVSSLWSDVRSYWDAFQRRLQRQSRESLTTITREQWVSPLLDALGYQLTYQPQGVEIDGRNYRISHRTGETEDDLPVHIEPCDQDLGSRPPSGRAVMSPHAMFQDYLNRTEHLWGVLTNGNTLRLLRDSSYFTRPSYIEFDLRQMLEGERLDEFFLFYRLVHRSRLPKNAEDGPSCLLERYHQLSIEQGGRIRDGLRNAVEKAIVILANGFLSNGFPDYRDNARLREDLQSGRLSATDFYRQLLYLVYRLLFLMVAEERGLLSGGDGEDHSAREYFTVQRLRALADEPLSAPERFCDLYLNLRALFHSLCNEQFAQALGLPPLNGELFDCARTSALSDAYLNNRDLLKAMHTLSWFVPRDQRVPTRVNYRHLDVEELGSVYESLLDLQPIVEEHGGRLTFRFGAGTERKTTGSYYTRPELVQELIKSALVPVIEDRLADARRLANGEWRTEQEARHACAVVSRTGGLAAGNGTGEASLRADQPVPGSGDLRDGVADSASSQLGPGQHRGGVGEALSGGVHPVHTEGQRQPDGVGDAPAPLRGGGTGNQRPGAAAAERVGDSRQAAPRPGTGPEEASGERRVANGGPSPLAARRSQFAAVPLATRYSLLAERALLSLTVCDPACGSGHFLLAAARRIGTELAKVRTGEEAPAPDAVRAAVRDVITHCIYGVDKNPLAVDLCKVALWIEGHSGGKPLTFLDHRIRCGDSLVGVFDLSVLEEGIPDAAFDPVSGDDKAVARAIKKRNKQERQGQTALPLDPVSSPDVPLAIRYSLLTTPDDTPTDVHRKRDAYAEWERAVHDERMACHLWTAAFFSELTQETVDGHRIPTTEDLRRFLQSPDSVDARLRGHVWALGERNRFFHWPLEFPEVFEQGGFDCVLSNPPWEQMQLDPKEFFRTRDAEVAAGRNMAETERLIRKLSERAPGLYDEYRRAQAENDYAKKFIHASGRFPLTEFGRINLAPLFAEQSRAMIGMRGRVGVVVPSGIATDSYTQHFLSDLMDRKSLVSLLDFENRSGLFAGVHRSYKFSLVTVAGRTLDAPARFAFFLTEPRQAADSRRVFSLSPEEIRLLNPNTGTCPVFRTTADAELTKAIYRRVPVLVREAENANPWRVRFLLMFMMNTDSRHFRSQPGPGLVPLYEAKMIWQFDHRFGSYYEGQAEGNTHLPTPSPEEYADPCFMARPRYWVPEYEVQQRSPAEARSYYIVYRRITNATNERTTVAAVIPLSGPSDGVPLIVPGPQTSALLHSCLVANMNSLPQDYLARQRVGGLHLDFHHLRQVSILPPDAYTAADLLFIVPRVVELTYTAWDIKAFADDVWREGDDALRQALQQQWEANRAATGGQEWDPPEWAEIAADGCPLPPFKWSDERRAVLRAELDAYYARLYGLTRKQLRYVLDPHGLSERELQDILDPWEDPTCQGPHLLPAEPALDFPGETFRVLKEKEEKAFGEYRTRRLVLEAWERQARTLHRASR